MKKILTIIVLSLFFFEIAQSASIELSEKLIEKCTNKRFEKFFKDDPINLSLKGKTIKERLENPNYNIVWKNCEKDLKQSQSAMLSCH